MADTGAQGNAGGSQEPGRAEDDPRRGGARADQAQGRDRAGDQEKDGRVVERAHHMVGARAGVDAVVQGAQDEQRDQAQGVDAQAGDGPDVVGGDGLADQQRAADHREDGRRQMGDAVDRFVGDVRAAVAAEFFIFRHPYKCTGTAP